jgi:HAD superfamily hydrolase (TIGR01484 family)
MVFIFKLVVMKTTLVVKYEESNPQMLAYDQMPTALTDMKPLTSWPISARANIVGVFTDIDDTLTTEGGITPDALQALQNLKAQGLMVIPITGRPVGWSIPFASTWPVDAMVAENGAVALLHNAQTKQVRKIYQQDLATRTHNFQEMQRIAKRVLKEIPGTVMAQDSPGRETDIAFDHSEFHHLSQDQILQVTQLLQQEGMTATVSSIHINAWFGDHNKWHGAQWILKELTGRDLKQEIDQWVYVGDSTNDQVMFEHFTHSVGVANIRRFEKELKHLPKYIAQQARGAGFAEVATQLRGLQI